MIRKLFFIILFFCVVLGINNIYAADTISGNTTTTGATFSFPVKAHVFDQTTGIFFVGAYPSQNNLGIANNFALSQLQRTSTAFKPLAPQLINKGKDKSAQENPLFDAGIEFISLLGGELTMNQGRPIVVRTGELDAIYFIADFFNINNVRIFKAFVFDANGAGTSGIVGLTGSPLSFAFAAVKPNGGGDFGDAGSGIGSFIFGVDEKSNNKVFKALDAQTGATTSPKAVPLDITSAVAKIQNDLASIGQVVAMEWCAALNRLYIGLQITAGGAAGDGGRAVVMARLENNNNKTKKLILEPIAPDAALAGTDKIIGATGAGAQVSVHHLKCLLTSTALPYLIVQGGNGSPSATRRSVFGLPLASGTGNLATSGTIADKNSDPEDSFATNIPFQFFSRNIKQVATTASQMTTSSDPAALVGGGDLAAGDIDEIFVRGDAVFAVVGAPDTDQLPGIFTSQALLDSTGKIKAWTQWQRVAGTTDQAFGAALDVFHGNFTFMTGIDIDSTTTIKRTKWGNGASSQLRPLSDLVSANFTKEEGGVFNLFDLPPTTPGLNDISLLIATGLEKVLLVESGQVISGVLNPLSGNYASTLEQFDNGSITKTFPNASGDPKLVEISGGGLSDIGPITAAEIATNGSGGSQGYLFVGGINGLAVLSAANGDGWATASGLGPDFAGLTDGMSLKAVGSYSFVRKLIYDDNFLYVLTNDRLDRIDLTQAGVGLGTVTPVTIADLSLLGGYTNSGSFADVIVSEKFAMIATSFGIIRVGNGKDIRSATGVASLNWEPISIPEWSYNVQKLVAVSATGRAQDVARNNGGQVYVVSAYRGNQRSQINRFAIEPVVGTSISDSTIKTLPDFYVKDIPSFLINYGELRLNFVTDGAMYFGARDRNQTVPPQVVVPSTAIEPRSGIKFAGLKGAQEIPLTITGNNTITQLFRNFASGSWIVSGDFGLQINE